MNHMVEKKNVFEPLGSLHFFFLACDMFTVICYCHISATVIDLIHTTAIFLTVEVKNYLEGTALQVVFHQNSSIWLLCERSTDLLSSSCVSLSPAALSVAHPFVLTVTKVISHFWFLMALSCLWSSLTAFSNTHPLSGGLVHAACP